MIVRVSDWWHRNITEPGKLPLLVALGAFVVTFLVTRTITRMIRAGVGPFRDNVSTGGLHVHHAVPGIVSLVVGAFVALGATSGSPSSGSRRSGWTTWAARSWRRAPAPPARP